MEKYLILSYTGMLFLALILRCFSDAVENCKKHGHKASWILNDNITNCERCGRKIYRTESNSWSTVKNDSKL